MKSIPIFILFLIMVGAQLFVPSQMIFNQEQVLKAGTAYKFKTQPVDPSNPFKGKYIYLNYEVNSIKTIDTTWRRGEEIYVTIANDSLGFAMAQNVTRDVPKEVNYVKAKVDWYDKAKNALNFSFDFNEFYMNELKAYDAEVAHRKAQNDSNPNNTYALIYIKDGKAVLDNVFINDVPIADYVD